MNFRNKVYTNNQSENWLPYLIFILTFPICVSILINEVISLSVEDTFMKNSIPETLGCHDAFDTHQCVVIEDALNIVVRRFDEKIHAQKENFEKKIVKLISLIHEMKVQNDFHDEKYFNITEQVNRIQSLK